jgi:hypothetical protein
MNIKANPINEEESTAHNKVYSAWRNPYLKGFFIFSIFYQLLNLVAFFGAPRHHIQTDKRQWLERGHSDTCQTEHW